MRENNCETDAPERITGKCPYQPCRHNFDAATVEAVGDHFREHLVSNDTPPKLAGKAAVKLMASRAK